MTISLRRTANFIKWRLVPIRHLGRLRYLRPHHLTKAENPQTDLGKIIDAKGYHTGPIRSGEKLKALQNLFMNRAPKSAPDGHPIPFVNLLKAEDLTADNALMKLVFSPEILDVVFDYYGGRARLHNLQVLHSFANDGQLKESQKWHLDYADSKSLHCVMYLNDVLTDDEGPFVFIDKEASKVVGRGLTVRRIADAQMEKEMQGAEVHTVYGKAGTSVWIDPAACYHYGSRCINPRTAVFLTFNSDAPFVAKESLMAQNAQTIVEIGKELRPDLPAETFDRLLGL